MAAGSPPSVLAERGYARSPQVNSSLLAAGARLPLAFICLGLIALAVGAAWAAATPSLLAQHHLHPHVVALAHLWLLGFLLSICMGAIYQMAPVVLGVPPLRQHTAWIHLAAHGIGVTIMVLGFRAARFEIVAVGGAFVAAGVALFTSTVVKTFVAARRRDGIAWAFPLSAGWLALTVLAGVLLAVNHRWFFLPLSPLALLKAHAHLGLVGFFLTLLQGATFQLVPMFTLGELRRPRFVTAGLIAAQTGLLLLVPGLAWSLSPLVWCGAVALATGIALSGAAFAATWHTRRRRKVEPELSAFRLGAALAAIATAGGFACLLLPDGAGAAHAASAYGVAIAVGALGFMVLGMLGKIIPFLVWMHAYGPRVGRMAVPAATQLAIPWLKQVWLFSHLAALSILIGGVLTASESVLLVGAALLAVGATAFLGNAAQVFTHLVRPHHPPILAGKTL